LLRPILEFSESSFFSNPCFFKTNAFFLLNSLLLKPQLLKTSFLQSSYAYGSFLNSLMLSVSGSKSFTMDVFAVSVFEANIIIVDCRPRRRMTSPKRRHIVTLRRQRLYDCVASESNSWTR
jgi:hypothetical protein